ncbi:hypothetical protein [Leptospira noguchii]|nr:hypothetical protein [Leptospira noguchii]UOG48872.1 hypothetical protein MAL00_00625 [Leptospira noguchii]
MKRLSFNLLTIAASPVSEKLKQNSFSEYNQILKYKILSPKAAHSEI